MKKLYFALLLAFLFSAVNAQVLVKAVVASKFLNYQEGDSIDLYGFVKSNLDNSTYMLVKKGDEYKRIPTSNFRLNSNSLAFWDHVWFYNRAAEVMTKGWDNELRRDLLNDCRDFIQNLKKDKLLFDDDYLQDYLTQLAHKICPTKLNKPKNSYLTVYVMKSNEPQSFSFDNGTIVVSTNLLASLTSESELVNVLAKEVANIVLEQNLLNYKQQIRAEINAKIWTGIAAVATTAAATYDAVKGNNRFTFDDAYAVTAATSLISSGIMERIGVNFSKEQLAVATNFQNLFFSTKYDKMDHKTPDEYNRIISDVISYSAWQHFYAFNYTEALGLVNRLENAGITSEDDYLLKAKIYRTIYCSEESNFEALRCIKLAKNISPTKLIDLYKEEGLLYLRLADKAKAKTAFDEYRAGLEELQAKGGDSSSDLRWVRNTMYKNQL